MILGRDIRSLLNIPSTEISRFTPDRRYLFTQVGLARLSCPMELAAKKENKAAITPIVVEKNYFSYGSTQTFTPETVMASGAKTRMDLIANGKVNEWVWVEEGAIVNANRQLSSSQYLRMVAEATLKSVYTPNMLIHASKSPAFTKMHFAGVFPLENKVAFSIGDKGYIGKYIFAANGSVDVTVAPVYSAPLSVSVGRGAPYRQTLGALTSELMTNICHQPRMDIMNALEMFNHDVDSGAYVCLSPAFAPVPNVAYSTLNQGMNPIFQKLAASGNTLVDFALWSAAKTEEKTKTKGGVKLTKDKFAYAPSNDPATWKLPIHDADHVRDALARVNQTQGIPASEKPAVISKIRKAADKHGIDLKAGGKGRGSGRLPTGINNKDRIDAHKTASKAHLDAANGRGMSNYRIKAGKAHLLTEKADDMTQQHGNAKEKIQSMNAAFHSKAALGSGSTKSHLDACSCHEKAINACKM